MDDIHIFEAMAPQARFNAYRRKIHGSPLLDSAKNVRRCSKKLRVVDRLQAFAGSLVVIDDQLNKSNTSGFVLLEINIEKHTVAAEIFSTDNSKKAEAEYIKLESRTAKNEGVVVALVSSTAVGGIKEAYPNYFADSSNFVQLLKLIEAAAS